MRLLKFTSSGELSVAKFVDDSIPAYAILSHTWGPEDEEVTFKDLEEDAGRRKVGTSGYNKIQFCGKQAARYGISYFWVDTCCIDKSSSAELSEAINSMFKWYRNAARCFAYLSDVSIAGCDITSYTSWAGFEVSFRKSRWFTRGWTLQELLAPSSVEFFSQEGELLGDKTSLERQIHEITGIPVKAIQGSPLSRFTVKERLSWAAKRTTTRKEDEAYCLLGIFDIFMPLLYGEGKENAFSRLQEAIDKPLKTQSLLNHLPYAVDAPFNTYSRQHDPICLPDTRIDLLREIYAWADGEDGRIIYWLNGLAGTGKSTIARTVARKYSEKGQLAASFFFSRGGGDVGHASNFFTTIAVQLAQKSESFQRHICDALRKNTDIATQSLADQWRQVVLGPLSKLSGESYPSSYVLVVDALDECDSDEDIGTILKLLAEAQTLRRVRLRVLVTSRPEIPIRHGFYQLPETEHQDFVLQDISPVIVDHDITIFLEYKLGHIRQERSLAVGWPGEEVIRCLVQNASGLFIWAATACRFIQEGKRFAAKRLAMILENSRHAITAPEQHLNDIYITVLKHSVSPNFSNEEREELYDMLRYILGSVVVLVSPLSPYSLSKLLDVSKEEVDQTLDDLHAILDVATDQTRPLRLHHPSFRDFLLDKDRCNDSNFWVDEKQAHQRLAGSCIRLLSTSLKEDVCSVTVPGAFITDIESNRVEACLPLEVQYACLYWIQHLRRSGAQLRDNDDVDQFLRIHFLHWLEALSWIEKISEGILEIISLESIAHAVYCPSLNAFIQDMKRFALHNRAAIEQAPLQVYCSALLFTPMMSIVRRQFTNKIPRWVKRGPQVATNWSAMLQILEGHLSTLNAVAFSPNGKQLASGSVDKTVRVWDAATGATLQILRGHSYSVGAVAFSPDGKQLASGSDDKTVRVWDVATGATRKILEGHSAKVSAVAFSPDSKQLVSKSFDRTVRIWDTTPRASLQTLDGLADLVKVFAFSPDGKELESSSSDMTVWAWSPDTGEPLQDLEGHSPRSSAFVFSPDGKQLASGSADHTVRIWDVATGATLQTLEGHLSRVNALVFSPDGKQLASSSYSKMWIWDTATGVALQTVENQWETFNIIVFSPDGMQLASNSENATIQIWDVATGVPINIFEGHSEEVSAVAFSPDGKYLASASTDGTVRIWDMAIDAALQTPGDYLDWVTALTFSPDGNQLVSGSLDGTVQTWDVATAATLKTLKGHSNWVNAVAFSPNVKQLASGSEDCRVLVWDVATGEKLQTLKGHLSGVYALAFSPDGKRLASGSDRTVRIWDTAMGVTLQTLEGHSDLVKAVTFSLDGMQLASGSSDRTVRIWDTATGVTLQTLEGQSDSTSVITFSPDGMQLASGSSDRTVRIWDTATGAMLQTLNANAVVTWLSYSNDGTIMTKLRLNTISCHDKATISPIYSPLPPPLVNFTPNISVLDEWIMYKENRMLWLPPDYRDFRSAVHENIVCIFRHWGGLSICEFSFPPWKKRVRNSFPYGALFLDTHVW